MRLLVTNLQGALLIAGEGRGSDFHRTVFSGSTSLGWQMPVQSDLLAVLGGEPSFTDPFDKVALGFADIQDPYTGGAYDRDPRAVLRRTCAQAPVAHARYRVGFEIECCVFPTYAYGYRRGTAYIRCDLSECVSAEHAENGERFFFFSDGMAAARAGHLWRLLPGLSDTLQAAGIAGATVSHEAAPNQVEISLPPADPVAACDTLQLVKYLTRRFFTAHGLVATFAPKPVPLAQHASGLHMNLSRGTCAIREDAVGTLPPKALARLLGSVRSIAMITNPTTNSYRRIVSLFQLDAPPRIGRGDRTALVRIPVVAEPSEQRAELRFPDPSCNPYLATAVVLSVLEAADLDASSEIHPTSSTWRPTSPSFQDLHPKTMPATLLEALRAYWERRDFHSGILGPPVHAELVSIANLYLSQELGSPHPAELPHAFGL